MTDTQTSQPQKNETNAFWAAYREQSAQRNLDNPNRPQLSEFRGTTYIILSVLMMAFSARLSFILILAMYALWFPLINFKKRFALRLSADMLLPTAIGFLALLSTIWSDYPSDTLHKGEEYASGLVCMLLIARLTTLSSYIRGLAFGTFLVLVCFYIVNMTDFGSLLGSKNQVGLFAEVGTFASFLGWLRIDRRNVLARVAFLFSLLISLVFLALSHSASSVATMAMTFALVATLWVGNRLPQSLRYLFSAFLIAVCLFFGFLFLTTNMGDWLIELLGKDATLTGRTYLWQQGYAVGMARPWGGHGYSAFWVVGNPLAERYWYEFFEVSGAGFHFHNLFIQAFVDLGVCGVLLFGMLALANLVGGLRRFSVEGSSTLALASFGFAFMFLLRSFVEVDYLGPFGIGVMVMFGILPRLAATPTTADRA